MKAATTIKAVIRAGFCFATKTEFDAFLKQWATYAHVMTTDSCI
jgi:hypothetical protein